MKRFVYVLKGLVYLVAIAALAGVLWHLVSFEQNDGVRWAEQVLFNAKIQTGIDRLTEQFADIIVGVNDMFTLQGKEFRGLASWYDGQFSGKFTASGELFDPNKLTAAHRSLPFETVVRVETQATRMAVIVKINDRGPFTNDRIIDLSPEAAARLGILRKGLTPVIVTIISAGAKDILVGRPSE